MFETVKREIANLLRQHKHLLTDLKGIEAADFEYRTADEVTYCGSLLFLSKLMYAKLGQPTLHCSRR